MPFRPCPSGCGRFLSADDGHDRCLQCLGRRHAEAAFVDDSCVCCGHMSMISLRSCLSFMKGLAPSAATRADLSGSSRGSPADALGDLRVTVRASPPGALEQVSRHTVVTVLTLLSRAGALHATGRHPRGSGQGPTALAHQLPGAVGSAFSLAAVPATAVGQARASPHGQHCGGLVYQPAGGYTITPHVTARPPSPPLESHAV